MSAIKCKQAKHIFIDELLSIFTEICFQIFVISEILVVTELKELHTHCRIKSLLDFLGFFFYKINVKKCGYYSLSLENISARYNEPLIFY